MQKIKKIYQRTIFKEIAKYFFTDEIIIIHGARQTGKTYLLYLIEQFLNNKKNETYYIDLEDSRYRKILNSGLDEFLKHLKERGLDPTLLKDRQKFFILIDEIQYLENPSSFLKLVVDHHKNIKLIVSGSSSFAIKSKFRDSLVGRTIDFEIFPLSFPEFLDFKNYFINKKILTSRSLTEIKKDELKSLYKEFVLYGGYPKIVLTNNIEFKEKYLQQIVDTYIKKDIRDLANIRDINKFNKLVEILASQSGQLLNTTELSNTCRLSKQTIDNYLFILENTYIIKLLRPYYQNIRSELFKTPKIFFYDSGLMQILWFKQLQKEMIGQSFETSIFSELIKKYNKDNIFFWRTKDKKEIDFIVSQRNNLLPIEAKINYYSFDKTAIAYFNNKYKNNNYFVTALNGDLEDNNFIYPWMLN